MDVVLTCACVTLTTLLAVLAVTSQRGARARRAVVAELADVHRRHDLEVERLAGLALHDGLTGLPNRVLLLDRLRHALLSQDRRGGHVGVLFLDLDGFKAVNDGYGHAVGDDVLATVAARLRSAVRAGDTPARLSGDEFVVVCEGVDDDLALARAAARLEQAVAAPFEVNGRQVVLGVSVGCALRARGGTEPATHVASRLLAQADHAMYDVKRARQLRLAELGLLNQRAARSVAHV